MNYTISSRLVQKSSPFIKQIVVLKTSRDVNHFLNVNIFLNVNTLSDLKPWTRCLRQTLVLYRVKNK